MIVADANRCKKSNSLNQNKMEFINKEFYVTFLL